MKKKKVQYNKKTIHKGLMPPQAVDLEEAIVGGMLVDGSVIDQVLMVLDNSEVFYKEKNKLIFEAIRELSVSSKPIDLLTVANQLKTTGNLETIGGDFHLVELMGKVATTAHIEEHCRIVIQYWVKRKVIEIANQQICDAYAETVSIFDLVETAEKGLDSINEMLDTGKSTATFADALLQVVERVELLSNKENTDVVGVTTGFKKVDSFTGGWQNSDLVIIAARPGMGKTSLILKNLLEIALNNKAVGMFSLEMSVQQLAARLVAINSNFHLAQLIKKGFEHDRYFQTLNEVVGSMEKLNIYVDDSAGITIQQLQMKARMWKRKHNIEALFVDYIQLMSGDNKIGNREQEISTISRRLKQLAKELNIPVIALSQLSRSVEKRPDRRPRLEDLRESGAIEQDADTVCFIFRPEYYDMDCDEELADLGANTELIFAKYRSGSLETKGLYWQGDKTKFMDPEDRFNNEAQYAPVAPNKDDNPFT